MLLLKQNKQNKRIFLSTFPKTRFNNEVCSYFNLS